MNQQVNRKKLLGDLGFLQSGLSRKGLVEQMLYLLFTGSTLKTYNGNLSVVCPFESKFEGMVRLGELHSIVGDLTEDEVSLAAKGGELLITTESTKAGLRFREGEFEAPTFDFEEWNPLPDRFVTGLMFCLFSASRSVSQGVYTAVCIRKDYILSTDDYRVSAYHLDAAIGEQDILIPVLSALELIKFPVIEYCEQFGWVHFRTESGVVVSCRTMLGDFPDCLSCLEVDGFRMRLPKRLGEVMSSVSSFAPGDLDLDKEVEVRIADGKLVCRGERETSWLEKELIVKYNREPLKFTINPVFASQVLDKVVTMIVADDRILFTATDFKHLVCLVL